MSPIHVVASTNEDLLQDPYLRIHVSTSLCLRLLCKIHVSGFMSQHPCVSQDPLQDPCCRIHSSAAICISGSSTRSMSPDPCLRFRSQQPYVSQEPLQDPCLRIRIKASIYISGSSARSMSPMHVSASLYLRALCKIHVFGFMSQHPHVSQEPLQDPCLRIRI